MATRYEYNITEIGEAYFSIYSDYMAQTFKPTISHNLTSIKLKGYRNGIIGTITVTIRATSVGVPTGSALSTGVYDGSLLVPSGNGVPPGGSAWFEIPMSSFILVANITYATTVYCVASGANYLNVKNSDTNSYANGAPFYSADGINWSGTGYETTDMLFEEWGFPRVKKGVTPKIIFIN